MRQIILTAAAVCCMVTSYAQKNSVLLFGGAGINTGEQVDNGIATTGSSWSAMPGLGYQISDHVTFGAQAMFYHYGQSRISNVGAFGRYTAYLTPVFFAYLQINAQHQSNYNTNGKPDNNTQGYGINIVPGIGAFVYRGWAVNFQVAGISYQDISTEDKLHRTRGIGLNLGNIMSFGFSKNFGGHKKVVAKE